MNFKVVVDRDKNTQKFYFEVYEYGSETKVNFRSDPVYPTADAAQLAILSAFRDTKPPS